MTTITAPAPSALSCVLALADCASSTWGGQIVDARLVPTDDGWPLSLDVTYAPSEFGPHYAALYGPVSQSDPSLTLYAN